MKQQTPATSADQPTTLTTATDQTPVKSVHHSPCTLAAARCRLAAIAAIAEDDAPFVALAYAQQAMAEAEATEAAAADDRKDQRTVRIAWRWSAAAWATIPGGKR